MTAALTEFGLLPTEDSGEAVPSMTDRVREEPFHAVIEIETDPGEATVVIDDLDVQSVSVEGR